VLRSEANFAEYHFAPLILGDGKRLKNLKIEIDILPFGGIFCMDSLRKASYSGRNREIRVGCRSIQLLSDRDQMKQGRWIRWLSAVAAATALLILVLDHESIVGSRPRYDVILLYLGVFILPPFIAIYLTAFGWFWSGFIVGLWILLLGALACLYQNASPPAVVLVLCAMTICIAPFLSLAYRSKKHTHNESARQPSPSDKLNGGPEE